MEGEKELVLGNKQLISLFFVVVALCGVFFAMGYMMGRPSGKQVTTIPEGSPAAAPLAAAPSTQEPEPPRETAPVDRVPADNPPAQADSLPPEQAPATTQTQAAKDVAVPNTPVSAPSLPENGATYLQVTALRRSDADNLVKTLKEQNFPALLAESSKPELFRVMVGPYHQTADVADAKARLKALGFANAFVQR
jgi:cell division septation protein DedD